MNIGDFLQNPSGKGSALFYNRYDGIREMEKRLLEYLKITNSKTGRRIFNYKIYRDKKSYIFLFTLPSETLRDLHYDVIVRFDPNKVGNVSTLSIEGYDISFYSNSPHFIYTYAYVLNKMKMLYNPCKKINNKALRQRPKVRNPVEVLGFEKSIYSCALFIKKNSKNLFSTAYLNAHSSKWDRKKVCKTIADDITKLNEYRRYKKKVKKNRKPVKETTSPKPEGIVPSKEKRSVVRSERSNLLGKPKRSVGRKGTKRKSNILGSSVIGRGNKS